MGRDENKRINTLQYTTSLIEQLLIKQLIEYSVAWSLYNINKDEKMIFTTGLSSPETPRLLNNNDWLLVEMGAGNITRVSRDGRRKEVVARTGRPNGLAIDREGGIWVAESYPNPSIIMIDIDNDPVIFLTECKGEPFLFPNDLCFGPDGKLYMTDSGAPYDDWAPNDKLREDWMDVDFNGRVYRVDIESKRIDVIANGIKFTNGIAFGPDLCLYYNETITGNIYKSKTDEITNDSSFKLFSSVLPQMPPSKDFRGPDGMAFGEDGLLYCAMYGLGYIVVINPFGQIIDHIPTEGTQPTNLSFGPLGEKKIYVTEVEKGQVEVFETTNSGFFFDKPI